MLFEYFSKYGEIRTCKIIYKHDCNVSRGFGFVIYKNREAAVEVINNKQHHFIQGKWVDCKSAILRQEMKPPSNNNNIGPDKRPQNKHKTYNKNIHQSNQPSTHTIRPTYTTPSSNVSSNRYNSHYTHQPIDPRYNQISSDHTNQRVKVHPYTTIMARTPYDGHTIGYNNVDVNLNYRDNYSGSGHNYSDPKKNSSGDGNKKSTSSQTPKNKDSSHNVDTRESQIPHLSSIKSPPTKMSHVTGGSSMRLKQMAVNQSRKMPMPVTEMPEYMEEFNTAYPPHLLPHQMVESSERMHIPIPENDSEGNDNEYNNHRSYYIYQSADIVPERSERGFFTPQAHSSLGQQVYPNNPDVHLHDKDKKFFTPTHKPQETGFSGYYQKAVGSIKRREE